jgi:porin
MRSRIALCGGAAGLPEASRAILGSVLLALWAAALPSNAAETNDPVDVDRWQIPKRGALDLPQDAVGPGHPAWDLAGRTIEDGKRWLAGRGLRFDVDLDFFDQYASEVESGRQNFASFSWRIMGGWKLLDLGGRGHDSAIGTGHIEWTAFGTAGLDYDPAQQTLTANVGSATALNATVTGYGAVVDELYWKQMAFDGSLAVLGGKVDMLYHFDSNRVAGNAYAQFYAYPFQNNPSIPGPAFGGFGAIFRFDLGKRFYMMLGMGDSSMDTAVMPWVTLENDSWYQLLELGLRHELPGLGAGNFRLTPWHNHLFGQDGFGIALNVDQELGRKDIVAFFRFGYGDADVTPVEAFVSGGVVLEGPFGRTKDRVGFGVAWSDPSPSDGFRAETLLELYYRVEIVKSVTISPDLQLVFDPADDPYHDFVVVPGIRLHMTY